MITPIVLSVHIEPILTHTHTHSLTQTHTHTHTYTYTHTHAQRHITPMRTTIFAAEKFARHDARRTARHACVMCDAPHVRADVKAPLLEALQRHPGERQGRGGQLNKKVCAFGNANRQPKVA